MQRIAKPVRIPLFPTREQRERLEFFIAAMTAILSLWQMQVPLLVA